MSSHDACVHGPGKNERARCRRLRANEGVSSPQGDAPSRSQTRSRRQGSDQGRPTVREHNQRVRDTGKVGKEPDDEVCKHPNRYRQLCVDCERVVPMPARRKGQTIPRKTIDKYNAIIERKVQEGIGRRRAKDPDGSRWITDKNGTLRGMRLF